MSKVASAAAAMGVGEDQLAAQLSTIISVTRQAPETVGTALRTVYARITDIQAGIDEDGVTLGKYSGDMAKIGFNVLDVNGKLRNMGEVMEEIGNKWKTLTDEQQISLAQTMAGQRQYSNLIALFDNFDKYQSALNTAQNAGGKLQEQQDIYMDRLSTHVQQLTTATEHMWMGLVDTDGFKDVIDGLTTIVEKVDKLFQSIGGGKNLLQSLIPIVMSLTSKTVASGINTMISNAQLAKRQKEGQLQSKKMAEIRMEQLQSQGRKNSQVYKVNAQKAEFFSQPVGSYSAQQMEQINARWNASLDAAAEADLAQEKLNSSAYLVKSVTNQNILEKSVTAQQKQQYAAQAEEYYAKISESLRDQLLERERNRRKQAEAQEKEAAELQQQLRDQAQLTIIHNQQLQQAKKYQTSYKQALNNLLQAYKNQNNIIKQLQVDIGSKKSELKNLQTNSQLYHTKYITPVKQLHGLDSTQRDSEYKIMEYIFKKNQEYISFSEKFNNNGNPKTYQAALGRVEDRDNLLQRLNTMRASRGGAQISNFQQLNKTYGFMFDQASGKMKDFSSVMQQVAQTMLNYNKQISDANRTIATLTQQLQQRKSGGLPELARVNSVGAAQALTNRDVANTKAQLIESYKNMQNKYALSFDRKNDPNFSILTEVRKKGVEVPRELAQLRSEYRTLTRQVQTYNSSIKPMLKRGYEDNLGNRKSQLQASISGFLEKFKNYLDTHGAEVKTNIKESQSQRKDAQATVDKNFEDNKFEKQQQKRQEAIQSLIQLTSGLSQVTAGFQSLMKIGDIWSDNTITTTEKISQSFSNLVFNLPMMLTGIVSIVKALKNFNSITELLNIKLTLNLKLKLQHLATNAKLLISTIANNVANLGFVGTLKLLAEKFKEVAVSATTAQMTLGAFLIVAAAVATAILLIKSASQKNSKQAQATIEQNKKLLEQEKEKQDLLANQKNMIDQLKEINKQYQDGSISRAQLKDKINELEEKYKDESDTIRNLTQDYNNLTDAIKGAQEKYDQEKLASDKRIADAKANIARNTEQGEVKGGEWWRAADLGQLNARARGDTVIQVGTGDAVEFGQKLRTELQGRQAGKGQGNATQATILGGLMIPGPVGMGIGYALGKNSLTQVNINDIQTKQQLKKVVQGLQAAVDTATEEDKNTATYNSTIQILTSLQKQLEEWEDADLAVLNDLAVISAKKVEKNFNNIDDFDEYQKAYQKSSQQIYNDLKDNKDFISKTTEEKNKIIAQKLEAIIPDDLKEKYSSKIDAINKINHYNGAGYFGLNETDDEIIDLINGLNEEQLSKFLSLDIEDMQTLDDVKRVLKTISEYDFKNLDFNIADAKKAAQTYNNMANALQKVQNSKAISTKDFEEDLGLTDEIKSYFRLGNNGYILKDESQRKTVEQLIKQQQRSGWDDKYRIQKNIQENEQSWLDSKANNYNPQMWSQLPPQEDRISQEDKKILQELKEGSYTGLKEKYIKTGIVSEEEWDNKIQQIMQQTYGRNFFVKGDDKTQFYKKAGKWLSEEISTYNIDQQQSNINDINVANAQKMIEKLESVNDEEINVQLSKFKGYIKDGKISKQDYEKIYNYFDDISKSHKGAAEKIKEARSQQQEALLQIHESIFPTDDDVDETIVAKLGEQFQLTAKKSKLLDDALESNAKKAKDVAEEVQRYNSALSRVIKNYATWQNKLSGSTADKLLVAPQIKDAMADTLGISENTLSDTFVTTTQNLEDMRLALEGDEEAYKRLQQAAYEDILIHIGLDDADLNEVQILLDEYFKDLDLDVAVGAELDDAALEEVLATLIKKGIDTEQQLEAIFASKGVDLDVVVEDGKAEISSYTKAATYELKEQEKSQEELKNLERERIKNQKELTKYLRDDRDLYHEINILLKDQERIINRITKNQDSMYGAELLQNLSAQTNELKKQQSLLKRKQQLQLQDMANRRSALAAQGAAFDANGNISNYNNLISSAMNQINEVIGRQNSIITAMNNIINSGGSTSDEAYKDLDAQMTLVNREKSNAQDYLNNLKSDLSAYESVKSEFENVIDQLSGIAYQKIELRLKEFKVKVDVKLDLIQLQKDYDDFRRNIVEHDDILNPDNVKTILKDSAQYFSDALAGMNYLPALTDDLQKAIDEANKFNNVNYDPTQDPSAIFKTQGQARAYLQQTLEKVNSQSKDILSNIDEIKNKILDLANELKDVYDKQEQHLTFIREQTNHNISLSKLLYGEESYKNLNKYYDQLKKYNLQSVADAKSQQEMFLELYQKETNQALKDIYLENYKQATKTLNSILESSLQDLKTRYENVIDGVLKNTRERLGFTYNTGLEWDLMKKQNDAFLDNVNSAFAIKNTEFLYNQAINDIDNISTQQKLKKVMDQQLEILKEKEKLTQYDVDRAQKVLDIEKARIALEEAQNNKTNMKLKRDSQGNYSYQYVVDQDEIAKAQNDLQKAQNDLYNFDKENYIKNLDQAQQLYEEYAEKIKEIKLNDNLTEQEQIKAIALLNEDFNKRGLNIWKQNEFIKKNLMDSTANNLKIDLGNMSEAERNYLMGQSIPMWGSAAQEILNKFINDPNSVQNELNNMYLSLNQAQNDYEISIEETLQKAGTSYEDFKNTAIDPVIKSMETLIKDNNKLAEDAEKIVNKMQPLKTTLEGLTTKWDEMKSKIEQVNEAITEYLRKMGQAALAAQENNDDGGDSSNSGGTGFPGTFKLPPPGAGSTPKKEDPKKQSPSLVTDPNAQKTEPKAQNPNNKIKYMTLEQALQQEGVPNFQDEISKADMRMPPTIKETIRGEYAKARSSGSSFGYSMYRALSKSKEAGGIGFLNQQMYGMTQSIIQTIVSKAANRAAKSYGWGNNYLGRWGYNGYHNPEYIAHVFSNQKDLMKDNGLIKKFWSSFDTGGYTGSWNSSEGKIAMLHQKELVLNKQDTKNILNAVSLVRTITSNLTSNLISQINNIDKIKDTTKSLINDKNNEIEQNVKIQANFPNVNSKQEIEDAFAELVNMAAQRALERTRKK